MNIVFIVVCSFPYGDASSVRALNICHLLNDAGHTVHVISDYPSVSPADCDFCTYEHVADRSGSLIDRRTVVKKSLSALKAYCLANRVEAVLTNARFDRYDKILRFCKNKGLKLVVENCEWYHFSNFKLKLLDFRYWKNQWMIKKGFKRADGFISISRLLDRHNGSFGIPSVRIPTIMDTDNVQYRTECTESDTVKIAYTGNPGKSKELLSPIILALAENKELQEKIQLHIYGPDKNKVLYNIGNDKKLLLSAGSSVIIHGKVPQNEMNSIVKDSDYVVFLRPNRRSSNAGFPTKLGESMAAGTPVISNDTGDIGLYLKNGVNGFVCDDTSKGAVIKILAKITEMNKEQKESMRKQARLCAEEYFDYKKYVNEVKKIF